MLLLLQSFYIINTVHKMSSSSDDEAPEDISFKHSKEIILNETKKIHNQINSSHLEDKERNKQRQQLYKEQKDKKKLDLAVLQEANKELEEDETGDNVGEIQENEKVVFSESESDDDSGINIRVQDLNSKVKNDLYADAMNFKKNALYGKRINRVTAEERKRIKTKRKK